MNEITVGDSLLDHKNILSGTLVTSHAAVGESLAIDTLTIDFDLGKNLWEGFIPKGESVPLLTCEGEEFHDLFLRKIDIRTFTTNTPIYYRVNNDLVGKYFLQKLEQKARNRYQLIAQSVVGLLANAKDYGGVFVDAPVSSVLNRLLTGYEFTIDAEVSRATIRGYLPIGSKRDNLQQILFAVGGALFVQPDGSLFVTLMSNVPAGTFHAGRCYVSGTVNMVEAVDGVQVTEHNYFPTTETEVLFDDAVVGTTTIEFDAPHHDYIITGGTITASGANFCTIQANGSVTLTGGKYTHITRAVSAGDVASNNASVKSITDATLANPAIAQTLAERMLTYLNCNTTIHMDVLFGSERAGNAVTLIHPYSLEISNATIQELQVSMSAKNKASGVFLLDFIPEGVISGYTHSTTLRGSGVWTVPANAGGTIRIILVGGGAGGTSGVAGENGKPGKNGANADRSAASAGTGGSGGKGGKGGESGKIFEYTLQVQKGWRFKYTCGVGGTGGNAANAGQDPNAGTPGTASIFGDYSSDFGRVFAYGYVETKSGSTFGTDGASGVDAGAGGDGAEGKSDAFPNSVTAEDGENIGNYKGGKGTNGTVYEYQQSGEVVVCRTGGGAGGGASGNANGQDGQKSTTEGLADPKGGKGGNGANGNKGADGAYPGAGGSGGNGGGGGGGGGAAFYRSFAGYSGQATTGDVGLGGKAGAGGKGGDGLIVIYF